MTHFILFCSVGSSIAEFCVGREDIEDRRYTIFIEPDLLASFSFGPVPSSAVKALLKANKKRKSPSWC
jgi:hypothetical protein